MHNGNENLWANVLSDLKNCPKINNFADIKLFPDVPWGSLENDAI